MPHGENVLGPLCHLESAVRVCMLCLCFFLFFFIEGLIEADVTLQLRGFRSSKAMNHHVSRPVSNDSASDVALTVSW